MEERSVKKIATKTAIMRRAAFFDRDGTINKDIGYLYRIEDLQFIKGVPELIRSYNEKEYLVIVITNQSGIARGYYTVHQMNELHRDMNRKLEADYGAHIDAFYFCPHLPAISGECNCRKPKPGLFLQAIKDWNIDVKKSVSYGDSYRDEEASRLAGINNYKYIQCCI